MSHLNDDPLRAVIAEHISEGLGAVLRKFCDSPEAKQARHYLHAMPKSDWRTLIGMLAEESAGAVRAALAAAPQPAPAPADERAEMIEVIWEAAKHATIRERDAKIADALLARFSVTRKAP